MRAAAAAAALTVLGVFLSLGCLSAHRPQHNQAQQQTDEAARKKRNQPHIIFILADDQGFNDVGYHNPTIKTPTLDKLAAEGVKLENYYVQPICTPSRSQLITGRYQIHTGLQHSIIRPRQPSCLPLHMDTLPERLREAGYTTHLVGKWHLGFYRKACLPTRKGFDSFFGSLTGSVDYYSYGSCDGKDLCGYDLHDDEGVAWGQEGKYSTTLFTQRARKILESHDPAERPLFLLIAFQAVHTPLNPPESYIYPFRDMVNVARRNFAAMVSTVDEAVRNVTYALRKYGYYRNSVIIYSTDNGAQPFTGGSNWPLRGRKGTYWEGGVRGVAFVHSPLLRRRRRVSKALLHITDWFPTLVGLAGGNISQSQGLDGFDVWPAISEGRESPRKEILHNIDPLHKPPTKSMHKDVGSLDLKLAQRPDVNFHFTLIQTDEIRICGYNRAVFSREVGFPSPKRPKTMSVKTSKGKALKKLKKKKVLKKLPKQKLAFKLKPTKKPRAFSHHATKPKSKPLFKKKLKPRLKSKPPPKTKKTKANTWHQPLSNHRPHLKSSSSDTPSGSGISRPKAQPQIQTRLKTKFRRTASQKQNYPQSSRLKSKTLKLHSKPKSKRTLFQYQNKSQPGIPLTKSNPTPQFRLESLQPVWDTSIQAAIRVGDWKLLTGDPGHGDWVPPQMLPTPLPGRWWNLERSTLYYKSSVHKSIWLFNITGDPYERYDLAGQRPDVVQQLLARLAYYNQTAVPVYFPPDDPRANPSQHRGAWVPWVEEEEDEEGKYQGVYKKSNNKRKKNKCMLCNLQSFFLKMNEGTASSRI